MNPIEALRDAAEHDATRPDPWKLRCLRELRGIGQVDLGREAGWATTGHSCPTISRIERYDLPFGPVRAGALALALGVHPSSLMSSEVEYEDNRAAYQRWRASSRSLKVFLLDDAR